MQLSVNGHGYEVTAEVGTTLAEVLRDHLALTGTKLVCDRGECGACTVLVDGAPVYSCLTLAAAVAGTITTIEGLGGATADHPLQRAFMAHDAAQCGFCTPGQLLAASALLARIPSPSDAQIVEGMSGNLCRCGTYPKILSAIRSVAAGEFAESSRGR